MIGRYQDQARVVWISEASVIQVLEAKRKEMLMRLIVGDE
jgi:hypothetical protein